jgi:hypothetical protein
MERDASTDREVGSTSSLGKSKQELWACYMLTLQSIYQLMDRKIAPRI